jgi:hypothetical protein
VATDANVPPVGVRLSSRVARKEKLGRPVSAHGTQGKFLRFFFFYNFCLNFFSN